MSLLRAMGEHAAKSPSLRDFSIQGMVGGAAATGVLPRDLMREPVWRAGCPAWLP
jgi:hypothetical protein